MSQIQGLVMTLPVRRALSLVSVLFLMASFLVVTPGSALAANTAPTLTPSSPALSATDENTTSAANLISVVVGVSISDPDLGAVEGIAVLGLTGSGTWEFSTAGSGGPWTAFGSVSNYLATLLSDASALRYVPNGTNGETATISYRAWDMTDPNPNGTTGADVSINGGSTSYSTAIDTASLTVNSVNDAPVMAAAAPSLTATNEETTSPGDSVSSIVGASITDVDAGAAEGIAVIGTTGNGTWEFSTTGGGGPWTAFGSLSDSTATVLTSTSSDVIRYDPDGLNGETATITYRAWDTSDALGSGTTGVDASTNDGVTPFSSRANTATLAVAGINDEPSITSSPAQSAAENQTAVPTLTATDPDLPAQTLNWAKTGLGADESFFSNADGGVLTFVSAPDFESKIDANADGVYEVEVEVDDGAGGSATQMVSVTVTDVNEAPTITSDGGGPTAAANVAENQTFITDVNAADPEGEAEGGAGLSYSLTGVDAALLAIDADGMLTFAAAPSFETKADGDGDGVYEVTVTVADTLLASDSQDISVAVTDVNEAPTLAANTGMTVLEGSAATVIDASKLRTTDPDTGDALTYTLTVPPVEGTLKLSLAPLSAGMTFTQADIDNSLLTYDHDGTEPAPESFTFSVTDGEFTISGKVFTIFVTQNNEAPTITSDGGGPTAAANVADPEGEAEGGAGLSYSLTGVDAALLAIDADGMLTFAAAPSFETKADGDGDGVYEVTVTVADTLLASDSQDISVAVTDVNDQPTVDDAAFSIGENALAGALVGTVVASDEDTGDSITLTIVGGDPGFVFGLNNAGVLSVSPPLALAGSPHVYTLTVGVEDISGAKGTATVTVTVDNVPPIVDAGSSPAAVDEGSPVTIGPVTYTDVAGDTVDFAAINWFDGTVDGAASLGAGIATFDPHTYTKSGVHNPEVCLRDNEGDLGCATVAVTVNNVAPDLFDPANGASFSIFNAAGVEQFEFKPGELVTFKGTFYDPGADDHVVTVAWGDDTDPSNYAVPTGERSYSISHMYSAGAPGGVYNATVTVTDGDGGTDTLGGPITVANTADAIGLVDPKTARWRLITEDGGLTTITFGNPGDFPIAGDWDCDGVDTPGMYRQADGFVYLRNSNTSGIADRRFFLGNPGDIPLSGDFNGDGCDSVSVYRPSLQRFFIAEELGPDGGGFVADYFFTFGNPGDKPFVADFDGDEVDEVGLHRESTGLVYYRNSLTSGAADNLFTWGDPFDRVLGADWDGSGSGSPGLYRPSDQVVYLRFVNAAGMADVSFPFSGAESDWLPVAGHFL